jgi:hypothetical protein
MRSAEEQQWFDNNMGKVRHIKIDDVIATKDEYGVNVLRVYATMVETDEEIQFTVKP